MFLCDVSHTRTILEKENMEQSLFKKYSKFQNFDKMLYFRMTRWRNIKLGAFRQYQNTKTIFVTKNMGQDPFNKLSKFQKFQLSKFTLTWSNEGKEWCTAWFGLLKRTIAKIKNIRQTYLKKNIWSKQLQWNTVAWLYLGTGIVIWWVLRGAFPRKES